MKDAMAKKSYSDMLEQIQKLQAEAQALRDAEISDVIARVREEVRKYDLTPEQVFGGRQVARKARRAAGARNAAAARYSDGKGNIWGGRGPRPRWLKEALASGASLESFLTADAAAAPAAEAATASPARKRGGARKSAAAKKGTRRQRA
jgi:DNA-binding protein H-NS